MSLGTMLKYLGAFLLGMLRAAVDPRTWRKPKP